ncbi:hypothetical protein SY83_19160 [Paenibacillus swuensis]|uniref:HTH araC/xylS-type domain-containing protein n=1 Tax=Paenibacillus swuensis TaxID=1178515 RepID=A0A172TPN3_9BACL|nr:hypothetical protein SY83_19160 [Paenibacillus swuensis]
MRALDDKPIDGFYHYHQGMEWLYIHEGRGTVIVKEQLYEMKPGQLFMFTPYQLHKVFAQIDAEHPYCRTVIKFEPVAFLPYLQPFPHLLRFYEKLWEGHIEANCITSEFIQLLLPSLIESLQGSIEIMNTQEQMSFFAVRMLPLLDFLRMLTDSSQSIHVRSVVQERYSQQIMTWLEDHLQEEFQLDALADFLHLSKHHVSRMFRAETGSSIQEYLTARRIRQACLLLHTTKLSIEHVGLSVGIGSPSYFIQLFKSQLGCTPLQYRNKRS